MLTPAIRLREKLATTEPVIGVMATDHVWPLLVEICKLGGLDYLVLDREHGCHTDETVAQVCQVARLADFPVLMRTVSCELSEIRRAIDLGPCGLLLPNIESASQLDAVRDAIQMPPRGKRRPGGMGNFWMSDFHYTSWRDQFEDHFIVIPQIESRVGVDNVNSIAAHPLTTAVGLGPYDLSADLGCCWDPDNAEHQQAIQRIREAATAAGKKLWIGTDAPALRAQGDSFLWIGTVSGLLVQRFSAITAAVDQASQ
ncbi:HpcH/HpaI aldolase family protein [Fuerstiella marisgermanici]|uniref:4-hydroxy-2-oxovalerate aldolase n=1 Tax=Fuerstiella marisgermanici TaxID=1891926 RepID=A0A1P8WR41_9PLAN|nr:aldolase/citrate lyase family protein [Fuerstiella marisgermanici]APZ96530.1 4-hydroxy-2-oxovalerate aldolase [Fuerstiella marisgermanici]